MITKRRADGKEQRNPVSEAILGFWHPYQVWPPLITEEASTVKSATNHLKWKKAGSTAGPCIYRSKCPPLPLAGTPPHPALRLLLTGLAKTPPSLSPPKEHRWGAGNPSCSLAIHNMGTPLGFIRLFLKGTTKVDSSERWWINVAEKSISVGVSQNQRQGAKLCLRGSWTCLICFSTFRLDVC